MKTTEEFEYFDTSAEPMRCRRWLKPVMWLLSTPVAWWHKTKVTKEGVENLESPYLLLCNHNSFFDFQALTHAIQPQSANYIVSIDAFALLPGLKWLMQRVGCVCKRKFTNDVNLVRQMIKTKEHGDVIVMYPEARYSLCGTTAVLPSSLGKFCKLLDIPVVTFMCSGHHVDKPFWSLETRGVKGTEAHMKLVLTQEQVRQMSVEQINALLVKEFQYDDFKWQKERGIEINYKHRARGLHHILYQCPCCGKEFQMSSHEDILECKHCGKKWSMQTDGSLKALEGKTEFSHIPDWYEWERANVRREVEQGTYNSGVIPALVRTLPNITHFIVGEGSITHDMNGFHLRATRKDGTELVQEFPVPDKYSCHIDYKYRDYGQTLDLSTIKDTWIISPHDESKFSLTKFALATEELYFAHRKSTGRECPPGLA